MATNHNQSEDNDDVRKVLHHEFLLKVREKAFRHGAHRFFSTFFPIELDDGTVCTILSVKIPQEWFFINGSLVRANFVMIESKEKIIWSDDLSINELKKLMKMFK